MNLKYMKVSRFEISYKKKWNFSPYSNFLRCTCSWVLQRNLITEGFNVQLTRFSLSPCQRRQCERGWQHHLRCHRHQSQRCWGSRNFPERSPLSNWGWMNGSYDTEEKQQPSFKTEIIWDKGLVHTQQVIAFQFAAFQLFSTESSCAWQDALKCDAQS